MNASFEEVLPVKAEWVALWLSDGMTVKLFHKLVSAFGSVENALSAKTEELVEAGAAINTAKSICMRRERLSEIEMMLSELNDMGVTVITIGDETYPPNLRLIDDAPPVVFVRGQILPSDERAIAIVGSRMATSDGLNLARLLAAAFSKSGWTVVSGLASGIDTEAHAGVMDAGGRTIAALGSGILIPENPQLAARIERNGALLSELHPTAGVSVKNWLARNRLVTGLSVGTLMVEGAEKSGSVHAATTALKQGRLLFIVSWNDELPVHIGNRILEGKATLSIPPDESAVEKMCELMEQHLQAMRSPRVSDLMPE